MTRKNPDGTKYRRPSIRVRDVTPGYKAGQAPCVCVDGASHSVGNHGIMHTFQSYAAINSPLGRLYLENGTIFPPPPEPEIHITTHGAAKMSAAKALIDTFPDSGCDEACIIKQLDAYHQKQGITDETVIKAVHTRNVTMQDLAQAHQDVTNRIENGYRSNMKKPTSSR